MDSKGKKKGEHKKKVASAKGAGGSTSGRREYLQTSADDYDRGGYLKLGPGCYWRRLK